jgi:hypothetical protein
LTLNNIFLHYIEEVHKIKVKYLITKGINKMRNKSLLSIMIVLLLVAFYMPKSYSQNPTVNIVLSNDTWDSHLIYEIDIYLLSTAGAPFELATVGQGLVFNLAAANGGTVTTSWVPGSSQLTNTAEIPTSLLINTTTVINTVTYRVIRIVGKTPPGAGAGSMISDVAPGTKLGRLRLTNTVDWTIVAPCFFGFAPQTVYPAACNAYVGGLNVNLTNLGLVTNVCNLTGPLCPVELSSFASKAQGRTVVLNWSTKTEKNSDRFEVERSLAANTSWSVVGTVKASVLSNSTKSYSYSDTKLQTGNYQYRLKMVDNDGSFSYSSIEAAEVTIPKDFALNQNYPNPFNPSTKIDYQVPVDAKVILEVYNITGQKVMELVNQEKEAGYYSVNFGTTKLASGIYIYRMVASDKVTGRNFTSIKKMMLLK